VVWTGERWDRQSKHFKRWTGSKISMGDVMNVPTHSITYGDWVRILCRGGPGRGVNETAVQLTQQSGVGRFREPLWSLWTSSWRVWILFLRQWETRDSLWARADKQSCVVWRLITWQRCGKRKVCAEGLLVFRWQDAIKTQRDFFFFGS
jgi:hypothetical protein